MIILLETGSEDWIQFADPETPSGFESTPVLESTKCSSTEGATRSSMMSEELSTIQDTASADYPSGKYIYINVCLPHWDYRYLFDHQSPSSVGPCKGVGENTQRSYFACLHKISQNAKTNINVYTQLMLKILLYRAKL
jgi:hypothetical protein